MATTSGAITPHTNMKGKTIALMVAAPILGFSLLAGNFAFAKNLPLGLGNRGLAATPEQAADQMQARFVEEAKILGVTVDQIKAAWAEGKTLMDVATSLNLTKEQLRAKLEAYRLEQMKIQLQAMVTKGIITQAQADKRLAFVKLNPEHGAGLGLGLGLGLGKDGQKCNGQGKGLGLGKNRGNRH